MGNRLKHLRFTTFPLLIYFVNRPLLLSSRLFINTPSPGPFWHQLQFFFRFQLGPRRYLPTAVRNHPSTARPCPCSRRAAPRSIPLFQPVNCPGTAQSSAQSPSPSSFNNPPFNDAIDPAKRLAFFPLPSRAPPDSPPHALSRLYPRPLSTRTLLSHSVLHISPSKIPLPFWPSAASPLPPASIDPHFTLPVNVTKKFLSFLLSFCRDPPLFWFPLRRYKPRLLLFLPPRDQP